VTGTHETEVAVVQRRELGLVESLDDSENGGIDEADIRVGVAVAEIADTPVVIGNQVFYMKCIREDVIEKRDSDSIV
jgi:hypothetical protein